jgi:hypothetical protein
MNLQTRKLELIKNFLTIQNEELISNIEDLLMINQNLIKNNKILPFTLIELQNRIDKSLEDSKNGKVIEVNELIEEIEKWN